jgi:hypothetical protein
MLILDHLLDASNEGQQERPFAEEVELLSDPRKPSGFRNDETRKSNLIGVRDEPENRIRKTFQDGLWILRDTGLGRIRINLVLVDARPVKFDHGTKDGFLASKLVVNRLAGDAGGLRDTLEAIPTKRNFAVISIALKASKYRNGY